MGGGPAAAGFCPPPPHELNCATRPEAVGWDAQTRAVFVGSNGTHRVELKTLSNHHDSTTES